ncbi:MAG: hypothetical protein R3321_14575 [Nitrososphaeraceae archaeon]|nr:hypothetical protein [Nitrososphaeraceae archaeon]
MKVNKQISLEADLEVLDSNNEALSIHTNNGICYLNVSSWSASFLNKQLIDLFRKIRSRTGIITNDLVFSIQDRELIMLKNNKVIIKSYTRLFKLAFKYFFSR